MTNYVELASYVLGPWYVASNFLCVFADVFGIFAIHYMRRVKKTFGEIAVRRPNLLGVNNLLLFGYNLMWFIDTVFVYPTTGGIPCTSYEYYQSIFFLLYAEIVFAQVWNYHHTLRRMEVLQKQGGRGLADEQKKLLRDYKKYSSSSFMIKVVFGICWPLHSLAFFIDWAIHPWLLRKTYDEYVYEMGSVCYDSLAYRFTFYCQFVVVAIVVIMTFRFKLSTDEFDVKTDLILQTVFFLAYNLFIQILYAILSKFLEEDIFYIIDGWVYAITVVGWYFRFCYLPVIKVMLKQRRHAAYKELDENNLERKQSRSEQTYENLILVLKTNEGYETFLKISTKEFCQENVLFWKEVDTYREKLADYVDSKISVDVMDALALEIIENSILPGSHAEINIPAQMRKRYQGMRVNGKFKGNHSYDLFEDPEYEVLKMLADGIWISGQKEFEPIAKELARKSSQNDILKSHGQKI